MAIDLMQRRGVRLRWLMVLIALLAALPIFSLHAERIQARTDAAVGRAYERAEMLAASGAATHQQTMMQVRRLLEMLTHIPAIRTGALPECDGILQSVHQDREWLTAIFVADKDGKGLCGGSSAVRSIDVSDRGLFLDVKMTGRYQISDVVIGRVTGTQVITASMPVLGSNGEFLGAIGAGINLGWVDQVAAETKAKFDGLLMVLDRNGRAIAYQQNGVAQPDLAALSEHPQIKSVFESKARTFEARDPRGVQRLFSVSRLPDSGIAVAVGLDRAEVLGPIDRSFKRDLFYLLAVTASSIGLALLVAEFGLLRGVRLLKTASQRLKAGKMGVRVRLPGFLASELHDLGATYNAMTAEFERIAYLDRLTGLPNRRYLDRHMAKRGEQSVPSRQAVLAIDIDGFKPVNDTHGHAVGDRVLALIARRIADAVDERGLLFRVGGDEFVAVVPLTKAQDRETARMIAEDVRQAMEQAIELDGLVFPIACSVGIAMVPEDAKTLSGALVLADAALYEAKRSGRNRVIDSAPPLAASLPDADPRAQQYFPARTSQRFPS